MSWTWFSKFISTERVAAYDCYLVEYDSVSIEMKILGARTSGSSGLSDYASAEADANDEIIPVASKQ